MTFRDVIYKNFIKGIHNASSYFFSGVFCIAMLFMYSTIIFMDEVVKSVDEYPMMALFVVTCLIITLFSAFFMNYSFQNFVSNKKKELGVYLILGMEEKASIKLLLIETMTIAFASLAGGMIIGSLLGRFFQLIVTKLVGLEPVKYQLSIWNYILTILVFVVLYAVSFFFAATAIKKDDAIVIMKEKKKKESKPYHTKNLIFTILGFALLIFSTVFVLSIATNNHLNSKPIVLVAFIGSGYTGILLMIDHGGKTLIHFLKKRKNYYSSMLTFTGIDFQYHQNIKIMVVLALLASIIVTLVGAPIALITISSDIAETGNYDIEYALFSDYREQKVSEMIPSDDIKEELLIPIVYINDSIKGIQPIISVADYNELYNKNLQVSEGEVYNLITTWVPGTNGVDVGSIYTLNIGDEKLSLNVCDSVKNDWICPNLFGGNSILILSQEDYGRLSTQMLRTTIHLVTLSFDWKKSENLVNELTDEIKDSGAINSRIVTYLELKRGYSVFLFVTCSMCFMFFVSTGFVLYFKQYNDIEEERRQYKRLYALGIPETLMKKNIARKMAIVYFIPLLGGVMGILLMYYLASLFGGKEIVSTFMKKGVIGFLCYAGSQVIFYYILKRAYTKDILLINNNLS